MTLERNDDARWAEEDAEQADLTEVRDQDLEASEAEEPEVVEIREEISETRMEMGGTLNELGDRLEPSRLMNEAKENVRDATIGRAEETAKGISDMVMETIKNNPIPAAMAGAGLALLWKNRSNGGDGNGHRRDMRYDPYYGTTGYDYGQRAGWSEQEGQEGGGGMRDRAGQAASSMGERAGGAASSMREGVGQAASGAGENVGQAIGQAGETAGQMTDEVMQRGQQMGQDLTSRLDRFMQASPIAVGAIAAGAGALIGALVPETEPERNFMGDASQQASRAVTDAVDEAGQKAEKSMDEAEQKTKKGGSSS